MVTLGHPDPAVASEFFSTNVDNIPDWYQQLVFAARAYVGQATLPQLALAPRPFVTYRKAYIEDLC